MQDKNIDFPQYRRLENNKSYYKIMDSRKFIELQQIGKKWKKYEFTATQYPEIIRIMEMIECQVPFFHCEANDFETLFVNV
jgi:hypothetical protein